jgi:hypothetical protein
MTAVSPKCETGRIMALIYFCFTSCYSTLKNENKHEIKKISEFQPITYSQI